MAVKTQVVGDSVKREADKVRNKGRFDKAIGKTLGLAGGALSSVNPLLGGALKFGGDAVVAGASRFDTDADNMIAGANANKLSMTSSNRPGDFVATDRNKIGEQGLKDGLKSAVVSTLGGMASKYASNTPKTSDIGGDEFGITDEMLKPDSLKSQNVLLGGNNPKPDVNSPEIEQVFYTKNSFATAGFEGPQKKIDKDILGARISTSLPGAPDENLMGEITDQIPLGEQLVQQVFNKDASSNPMDELENGANRMKLMQDFFDEMGIENTMYQGDAKAEIDAQFEEWLKNR